MPWHRKPWSTIDTPSTDSSRGFLLGGGYGTSFKMGELNAPVTDGQSPVLRDSEFESRTSAAPEQSDLQGNLAENNQPLSPTRLFAN